MKVTINQSAYLFVYMLTLHIVAISLLLASLRNTNALIILLLTGLVCINFTLWYRQCNLVSSLIELSVNQEKQWFLKYDNGFVSAPLELKSSTQMPFALFIYFRTSRWWQSQTVMIVVDAVKQEDWRKLRAELRHPDV